MLFTTLQPLVLASASPRRQSFLAELGMRFSICPAELDEGRYPEEGPEHYVLRIAREKAELVGARFPSSWVIAADTVVVLGDRTLGKPRSEEEAVGMLLSLAGRAHYVYTGYALFCVQADVCVVEHAVTTVFFADFNEDIARSYVRTGESLDKAGAYGIQGAGGVLVKAIDGSYSNVVGLPLVEVVELLLYYRVIAAAA